jgi:hypothetical protein
MVWPHIGQTPPTLSSDTSFSIPSSTSFFWTSRSLLARTAASRAPSIPDFSAGSPPDLRKLPLLVGYPLFGGRKLPLGFFQRRRRRRDAFLQLWHLLPARP